MPQVCFVLSLISVVLFVHIAAACALKLQLLVPWMTLALDGCDPPPTLEIRRR